MKIDPLRLPIAYAFPPFSCGLRSDNLERKRGRAKIVMVEMFRRDGLIAERKPEPPFRFQAPVTVYGVVWPNVHIGAHSYMNGGVIRENTVIGSYCSIACGVSIGVPSHATDLVSTHPFASRAKVDSSYLNPYRTDRRHWTEPTEIGHDVWIAQNAVVGQGVKIGTGAIIGAGAVVFRDVPPYAIVGGVPAKILRKRFPEEICDLLLRSQWWEWPEEVLCELPTNNIPRFCEELAKFGVPPKREWQSVTTVD